MATSRGSCQQPGAICLNPPVGQPGSTCSSCRQCPTLQPMGTASAAGAPSSFAEPPSSSRLRPAKPQLQQVRSWAVLLLLAALLLSPGVLVAPAAAVMLPFKWPLRGRSLIIGGVSDKSNAFSGVCAFLRISPTSGGNGVQLLPVCSGVLVTPSLVLTAAHCVAYFEGFVSCDTPLSAKSNTLYSVKEAKLPDNLNLQAKLSERVTDIALAQLNTSIPNAAVTSLPRLNDTGRLVESGALKNGSDMTVVGYGEVSSPPGLDAINRDRKYVATHFSGINSYTLRFGYQQGDSEAPCEGDSGGPAYLGGPDQAKGSKQLLGIIIGGDELCRVGGYILRLDIPETRDFLAKNGAPVP